MNSPPLWVYVVVWILVQIPTKVLVSVLFDKYNAPGEPGKKEGFAEGPTQPSRAVSIVWFMLFELVCNLVVGTAVLVFLFWL